jgi:glycosyltransferase involved in cell wall biosynthesis
LGSFYYYPATLIQLKRVLKSLRPDVINVHFPDAQVPFVLALRRRFSFRLVVSLHGHEVERWLPAKGKSNGSNNGALDGKRLLQSLLKEADAVTACSSNLLSNACQLEPAIEAKSCVIHNGVDFELHDGSARYEHPRRYVLSYGRLTSKKGFDLLLSAFAQVSGGNADVDLIIAGEGEELKRLTEMARDFGISERVHFFGRASAKQVVELLNGCLFLVVPSRVEPFGIVALEGMAAGKAVLATNVGGLPEFVDTSINKLVEPSIDDLAAGMQEWLAVREYVSTRGLQNRSVAVGYDWKHIVDGYLSVYGASSRTESKSKFSVA